MAGSSVGVRARAGEPGAADRGGVGWFGGQQDPLYLLDRLGRADSALAISKFRKVSPNLDLNKLKYLDRLQPEEMYDYAVGILSLMAPDHAGFNPLKRVFFSATYRYAGVVG